MAAMDASDAVSPSPSPPRPRARIDRRRALAGALLGGLGLAALHGALAAGLLDRTPRRTGQDWASPLSDEKARVMHLLRRATFGASPEEFERAASDGFRRTVDRLLEEPPAPPPDLWSADDPDRGSRLQLARLQLWWVQHMLATPTPFAERMTLFWHGHFTSDVQKVGLQTPFLYWQNLTWRQMALTDLRSMLWKVTVDPAMLRYLDLATSSGQAPNENYARELMERFTMGVGNYTEEDVRAAARALAGWVEPRPDRYRQVVLDAGKGVQRRYGVWDRPRTGTFVPRRAYQGTLTYLGRRGRFDTEAVLDAILSHPATAVYIAGKVAEEFVSPNVEASFVRGLADTFRSSGYDVKSLMRAVFTSPEFGSDAAYRALVKSPTEFMIHVLKAVDAPHLAPLVVAAGPQMGQILFAPPDVGGWPSNAAWVSSNNVLARVNFAATVVGRLSAVPPLNRLLAQVDGVLGPRTASSLDRTDDQRQRLLLLLASPEFQLK